MAGSISESPGIPRSGKRNAPGASPSPRARSVDAGGQTSVAGDPGLLRAWRSLGEASFRWFAIDHSGGDTLVIIITMNVFETRIFLHDNGIGRNADELLRKLQAAKFVYEHEMNSTWFNA